MVKIEIEYSFAKHEATFRYGEPISNDVALAILNIGTAILYAQKKNEEENK